MLLRSLEYASSKGYDLWNCTEKWMDGADGVNRLYDQILQTFEEGQKPEKEQIKHAKRQSLSDGGFPTLLKEHPWNASLTEMNNTAQLRHNANPNDDPESALNDGPEVMQDQWMIEASAIADEKLSSVRMEADKKLELLFEEISKRVSQSESSGPAEGKFGKSFVSWLESKEGMSAIPPAKEQRNTVRPNYSKDNLESIASGPFSNNLGAVEETKDDKESKDDRNKDNDNYDDDNYEEDEYGDDDDYEKDDDEYADEDDFDEEHESPRPTSRQNAKHQTESLSMSHSASRLPTFAEMQNEKNQHDLELAMNMSPSKKYTTNLDGEIDFSASEEIDMLEDVPLYLKGGCVVKGFGQLLGYALALLYVSRHGLKESEVSEVASKL
tara:strand:+ start:133 stop:1281 length:1149 start_codon:yes stop_codon:yes gene_type:complete